MYMNDNIDLVCNTEVTNYFNCIELYDDLSIQEKNCKSKINEYFSCLDSKRFKEGYLKKLAREKKYKNNKIIIANTAETDYLEYNSLSSL